MNFTIGKDYTLTHKESNPKEFERFSEVYWKEKDPENTYAFIHGDSGTTLCLYKGQQNYIMTGDGQTFACIKE